ncbi:serine protease [Streptomyces sp. NBC_01754]|uniref:trypsin-like peptidase domain-containing protein n=1 Tax=Streptomyces sp. NBC_01754 TaxID=2975930 RepID=UPI002DD877B4|nr:trypsin-like peptidase domain-containing protein [Streptomyces sp. NBC_01754]WSC95165.1 serine protease [Streptomyces sp. NBC_01754]
MGSGDRSTLVRICDQAGRPRGTGFVADDRGTVVTSHQAVASGVPLVLHAPDGRTRALDPDDITELPALGLALLRTGGPDALGVQPLPVAVRDRIGTGTYVRIAAHGWREARVLGRTPAVYEEGGRSQPVGDALELALGTDGRDALRSGGSAVGGPVTDPRTGAVLGVLSTALRAGHETAGLAVPLGFHGPGPDTGGPLGELLRRNAGAVPGYGRDLNLAGALQLTATTLGHPGRPDGPEPVGRPDTAAELTAFEHGSGAVLGLVGAPGTGRTTELAALAARRAGGAVPALTLWLRGADLLAGDASVAEALTRALGRSGRIVSAAGARGDMATATAERVAALATASGAPLLVVVDGPEEMPPLLAHRLAEWTRATVHWLRAHQARMAVACRPEHWETAGALYADDALYRPDRPARGLPPAVRLGELTPEQARSAKERYGIPPDAVAPGHDRHPLTLRLLAEVREALPPGVPGTPGTEEVFAAHLDLSCLRIAVRIGAEAEPRLRGTAVRRLAAKVAGQVHEAARRCLGPGQGELDRAAFEELFPWRTGWASAVLTEGLLAPAGAGYRFAHEELGDWVQGAHLDLDAALYALVHRRHAEDRAAPDGTGPEDAVAAERAEAAEPRSLPVPRHRIGPVLQAMLLLERRRGSAALAYRMADLIEATDRLAAAAGDDDGRHPARIADALWWAARLLRESLLRVPDARPYIGVLRVLAGRITRWPRDGGGVAGGGPYAAFAPWFWRRLALPESARIDLLRRLVPADGAPRTETGRETAGGPDGEAVACGEAGPHGERAARGDGGERYLDAVDRRLTAHPRPVQILLCRWFTDETPLHAGKGGPMRATVAAAAQALLYARRDLAVDDLTEALVDTAHPRAAELLATLAEDEPAALCRAVDRWARDGRRPERRAAAAEYAPVLARGARTEQDRALLREAALFLLARPGDPALHAPALTVLVRDPHTRRRHLARALRLFAAGDPGLPVALLTEVFPEHPETVLAALEARLSLPGDAAADVLRELARLDTPALALHAPALVRQYIDSHPRDGAGAAAYVDLRLEHSPAARALLLPLVTGLLRESPAPPPVRAALAGVLAARGSAASRPLRAELLEVLLGFEQDTGGDPETLEALLRAAAAGFDRRPEARTRALVHRTGVLLARTAEGAARLDRAFVELARDLPEFAALVLSWLADAPQEWAAVVGPGARRTVEALAGSRPATTVPMQGAGRAHGSLRPA